MILSSRENFRRALHAICRSASLRYRSVHVAAVYKGRRGRSLRGLQRLMEGKKKRPRERRRRVSLSLSSAGENKRGRETAPGVSAYYGVTRRAERIFSSSVIQGCTAAVYRRGFFATYGLRLNFEVFLAVFFFQRIRVALIFFLLFISDTSLRGCLFCFPCPRVYFSRNLVCKTRIEL